MGPPFVWIKAPVAALHGCGRGRLLAAYARTAVPAPTYARHMPDHPIRGHSTTPPRRPGDDVRRVSKPHIWTTGFGLDPPPGLLCSWRRDESGEWVGLVVVAEFHAGSDDPTVRQRWIAADRIYPHRPAVVTCAADEHLHRA